MRCLNELSQNGHDGRPEHILPRRVVVPGEELESWSFKPGMWTYTENGKIYASRMGFTNVRSNYINVVPLCGTYMPKLSDPVIGYIAEVNPTMWLVDINCPYLCALHVNEVPWRVDFGDTPRYLVVGDAVLVKISMVDEIKRIQLTLNDPGLKRLNGGIIMDIAPTKVPRIIGKKGSMISMIKAYTGARMFVGQNGRIWVEGQPEAVSEVLLAVSMIEENAQNAGLTDSIREHLERRLGPAKYGHPFSETGASTGRYEDGGD